MLNVLLQQLILTIKGIKDVEVVVGSDEYEALCAYHWFKAQREKRSEFLENNIKKLELKP